MRRRAAASALAIPLLIFDAWGSEARPPSPEEAAVRDVVESYFDGMMEGSQAKLAQAFHPEAYLIGRTGDGQITRIPFRKWSAGMNRPMAGAKEYRNEIAAIDITGDAAIVKTVLTWPNAKYVDYLSLVRDGEGRWQIVNKIWNDCRS